MALLIGYGHVIYLDRRASDQNQRTIYSLVAQRIERPWMFVAYQNTSLGQALRKLAVEGSPIGNPLRPLGEQLLTRSRDPLSRLISDPAGSAPGGS